jgi:hypothetical protein
MSLNPGVEFTTLHFLSNNTLGFKGSVSLARPWLGRG